MSDQIRSLLKSAKTQNFQDFARLLTQIERTGPSVLSHPELLAPKTKAFRIGITGPPGAGKSTLIGHLIKALREKDLSVGVIAVDPSSPFTQGAILGDRIRYSEHFNDPKVFIRSLGTRGSLGGLSASAYLMLRAFDHFKFDVVIIETVGVGQTELEIINVADELALVLVPESGDSIQAMKAGIMEITNNYIINKADRPGADQLAHEIEAHHKLITSDAEIKIFKSNSLTGEGIQALAKMFFEKYQKQKKQKSKLNPKKLKAEALSLLKQTYEIEAIDKISKIKTLNDFKKTLLSKKRTR